MHHCPNKFQVSANNNFSPGVNTFRDLSQDLTIFNQKFWVLKLSLAKSWTTFSNSKLQRFFCCLLFKQSCLCVSTIIVETKEAKWTQFCKAKNIRHIFNHLTTSKVLNNLMETDRVLKLLFSLMDAMACATMSYNWSSVGRCAHYPNLTVMSDVCKHLNYGSLTSTAIMSHLEVTKSYIMECQLNRLP